MEVNRNLINIIKINHKIFIIINHIINNNKYHIKIKMILYKIINHIPIQKIIILNIINHQSNLIKINQNQVSVLKRICKQKWII
jgi:hypothetical protein